MNADEQYDLKCLLAASSICERIGLERRFAKVKNGPRNWMYAKKHIKTLLEGVMDQIPTEQLMSLSKNLDSISFTVGIKKPITQSDKDFGLWLSYDAINALMESAHDTCMMCSKTGKEQQSCPLRKGLDELPVQRINETKGECPYYGRI